MNIKQEIIIEDVKSDWLSFGFEKEYAFIRWYSDILYMEMYILKSIVKHILAEEEYGFSETYYDIKIYPKEGLIALAHTYVGVVCVSVYLFDKEKLYTKILQLQEMLNEYQTSTTAGN